MRASEVLRLAREAMAGVVGEIALAQERRRPVPRATMLRWAERLEAAAKELRRST